MRRIIILTSVLLVTNLITFVEPLFGQPEQIQVQSMTFRYIHNLDPYASISATNSSGQIVVYQGDVTLGFPPLFLCSMCNIPNSFSADVFGTQMSLDLGNDFNAVLFVDNNSADPIVVSPRYMWKNRLAGFTGNDHLTGRLEIRDNRGYIIARDDHVALTGQYSVTFRISVESNGRRVISFDRTDYLLNAPLF